MPVAAYMALIFGLSATPWLPEPPASLSFLSDKVLHGILYGGLTVLLVRALAGGWRRSVTTGAAAAAMAIATLYGVTDEVHQHFVPPRSMDPSDVVADAVGAAAAAFGLYFAGRRK
jgi:VanZ family protein